MGKTITDLYYGNLAPAQREYDAPPRQQELEEQLVRLTDQLASLLPKEKRSLLQRMEELYSECWTITDLQAFELGFCTGVRLMAEALPG